MTRSDDGSANRSSRRYPIRRSVRARVCAVAMVLGLSACDYATGPQAQVVQPFLSHLSAHVVEAPIGPMIVLVATSTSPIPDNAAAAVLVTTSSGASAEILVPRNICGSGWYACRELVVAMRPGREMAELHELLAALDAAFMGLVEVKGSGPGGAEPYSGSSVGVVVVFSGSTTRVRDRLRKHPAVAAVEKAGTGPPGMVIEYDPRVELAVVIPSRGSSPTPPSALLHLVPGDEVTVRYRQPDGSELTATTRVQEN